jgi:hypothetical protein
MGKLKKYDSATDTWTTMATGGGSGSGGSGVTTMPLGYNFGIYITYKDADEIYVQPGNIDVNGTDVSITTATAHTMTSMVDATADFHYIYLAAAGTITDSATEPAWSDAKFGWYNGDTRCIGAVWVPSATPAALQGFENNSDNEYVYFGTSSGNYGIYKILSAGAPSGAWQDLTSAPYTPVNSSKIYLDAYEQDAGGSYSTCYIHVASYERKTNATEPKGVLSGAAWGLVRVCGWLNLGASRNISWWGDDNDDDASAIDIVGYKIRV